MSEELINILLKVPTSAIIELYEIRAEKSRSIREMDYTQAASLRDREKRCIITNNLPEELLNYKYTYNDDLLEVIRDRKIDIINDK